LAIIGRVLRTFSFEKSGAGYASAALKFQTCHAVSEVLEKGDCYVSAILTQCGIQVVPPPQRLMLF
jgi:hypothetical protein